MYYELLVTASCFVLLSGVSCLGSQQSRDGLFFGLINLVGNFSTVFIDQSYWQSAIAATPSASWKGFLLGGLCWFAIPYVSAPYLILSVFCPEFESRVRSRGQISPEPPRHGLCHRRDDAGTAVGSRWGLPWIAMTDVLSTVLLPCWLVCGGYALLFPCHGRVAGCSCTFGLTFFVGRLPRRCSP